MSKEAMKLALEAGDDEWKILIKHVMKHFPSEFHCFAELVRADERNSWPAEMEAMERQVNILTDALAQAMADEREACMNALNALPYQRSTKYDCMDAIRARSNT